MRKRVSTRALMAMLTLMIVGSSVGIVAPQRSFADNARTLDVSLTTARYGTSAIWDGQNAYIFGSAAPTESTEILKFDPTNNAVTKSSAVMPSGKSGTGAVYTGRYAYIFGGDDSIIRYEPGADAVSLMKARLPYAREMAPVAWTGQFAYMFGGRFCQTAISCYYYTNQILRYDPKADTVAITLGQFPLGIFGSSAIWSGQSGFIFGGSNGSSFLNQIWRYDQATDKVVKMSATLPVGLHESSAAFDGRFAYIFGGRTVSGPSNKIYRYDPVNDLVTTMNGVLPSPRYATSAVWAGQKAYVFGGYGENSATSEVASYLPTLDVATTMSLPSARYAASAAYDGANAYIAGGFDGARALRDIVKVRPSTGVVSTVAQLPTARYGTASAWAAGAAYVIGGFDGTYQRQIVRYVPSATPQIAGAQLPQGLYYPSAASDGTFVYIFGGLSSTGASDKVLRYDPVADTITTLPVTLPAPTYGISSVWTGSGLYLIGGLRCAPTCDSYSSQILKFDPSAMSITDTGAQLPTARYLMATAYSGSDIYLFGGVDNAYLSEIIRFRPSTGLVTTMSARLPYHACCAPAVWDGGSAYLFGGYDGSNASRRIVQYQLMPGPPGGVSATSGPGIGEITITWSPPADDTYSDPIIGYDVYRSVTGNGGEVLIKHTTSTTMIDEFIPNGAVRHYRVAAINAAGISPRSRPVSARAPQTPSRMDGPVVTPGANIGDREIRWQPPADDGGLPLIGYRLYRTDQGEITVIAELPVEARSYVDSGCTMLAICLYSVSAFNPVGEGERSSHLPDLIALTN